MTDPGNPALSIIFGKVCVLVSMTVAGLIGGFIYRWRPDIARRPSTGFYLAAGVSLLRDGLSLFFVPDATALRTLGQLTVAPILWKTLLPSVSKAVAFAQLLDLALGAAVDCPSISLDLA